MKLLTLLSTAIFAVSGYASADELGKTINSTVINSEGIKIGTANFQQGNTGTIIRIDVAGLKPGKLGMHFHTVGSCEDDTAFKTAEGHIMPDNEPHGYLHPQGPHAGNLPNLVVHKDGTAHVELYSQMVSVMGYKNAPALSDEDGSALIIHENEDDYKTQPIGGSGGRVACAVIPAGGKVAFNKAD